MLQITKQAADHLEELRARKGLDAQMGVRFVRSRGRLGLVFAQSPEEGDLVVPRQGIAVYVAPEVANAFERSTIDTTTEHERTRLVLRQSRTARR